MRTWRSKFTSRATHTNNPLLQSMYPITKCTPYWKVYSTPNYKVYPHHHKVYPLLQTKCTPYHKVYPPIAKVYTLIQSVPPITKCTPYHKVYPLLQSIPPITKCTPYRKVYTLIQSVPPITKCTPYYKVYPLSQSIYPNTKCTPYHKVYPLLQSIPPITNNVPYYTEVYPLSRSKYSQLRSMCTLCNKVCFLLIIPTPITRYLILTLITPHSSHPHTPFIPYIHTHTLTTHQCVLEQRLVATVLSKLDGLLQCQETLLTGGESEPVCEEERGWRSVEKPKRGKTREILPCRST